MTRELLPLMLSQDNLEIEPPFNFLTPKRMTLVEKIMEMTGRWSKTLSREQATDVLDMITKHIKEPKSK
jgi:hypothetical protein